MVDELDRLPTIWSTARQRGVRRRRPPGGRLARSARLYDGWALTERESTVGELPDPHHPVSRTAPRVGTACDDETELRDRSTPRWSTRSRTFTESTTSACTSWGGHDGGPGHSDLDIERETNLSAAPPSSWQTVVVNDPVNLITTSPHIFRTTSATTPHREQTDARRTPRRSRRRRPRAPRGSWKRTLQAMHDFGLCHRPEGSRVSERIVVLETSDSRPFTSPASSDSSRDLLADSHLRERPRHRASAPRRVTPTTLPRAASSAASHRSDILERRSQDVATVLHTLGLERRRSRPRQRPPDATIAVALGETEALPGCEPCRRSGWSWRRVSASGTTTITRPRGSSIRACTDWIGYRLDGLMAALDRS